MSVTNLMGTTWVINGSNLASYSSTIFYDIIFHDENQGIYYGFSIEKEPGGYALFRLPSNDPEHLLMYSEPIIIRNNMIGDDLAHISDRTVTFIGGNNLTNSNLISFLEDNAQQLIEYKTDNIEISSIADAIRAKGNTSAPLVYPAGFVSAIEAIELGIDTSDATATANDILSAKTAYVNGSKITGTILTKSATNLTANGATVTVPAGYYPTQATKDVSSGSAFTPAKTITTNPTITVNANGLITATYAGSSSITPTVTAGYVAAGTAGTVSTSGTKTYQLTSKAAATITPGTTDQTIAAGTYLTGTQTIKGDANLVASNIASGVTIFGVQGTFQGGTDVTDTTATADDVLSGTYFYTAAGVRTQGTLTYASAVGGYF